MNDTHKDEYPAWVCLDCGTKHGRIKVGIATWHVDECGVCRNQTLVTEPRDFGHLKDSWKGEKERK